jgi:iron complex transport system substrate-binding protein
MSYPNVHARLRFGALLIMLALTLSACVVPAEAPAASEAAATTAPSAAAGDAETVTVTHPQGEITLAKNPANVVVFEYSALDTLDLLGIPVVGVPQGNSIPPFLSKYQGEPYENVGSLFEPDYEKVNELQPGLVIIGGRSAATYPDLSEIAPVLDVSTTVTDVLGSMKAAWTNIGLIFDKEAEVAEHIAAIDSAVADLQAKAAASDAKALIVMVSGGEVTAYGPGSRFGLIHDLFGIKPVVEDIETATHGDAISFEFILEHDPDIIFVIDRDAALGTEGAQPAATVLDNELMHQTKAWQNDNLVYLDGSLWYLANAGLSTFQTMLAEVAAGLE